MVMKREKNQNIPLRNMRNVTTKNRTQTMYLLPEIIRRRNGGSLEHFELVDIEVCEACYQTLKEIKADT